MNARTDPRQARVDEIRTKARAAQEDAHRATSHKGFQERMEHASKLTAEANQLQMLITQDAERRKKQLGTIHIAKKRLGLDDDTYRDMLWTVARTRSAADLDEAGRLQVIEHLRAQGFTSRRRGQPRTLSKDQQLQKIEAQLTESGRPWSYAHGIAKRMFKKDDLQFCSSKELSAVIAALWKDAKRKGQQ